MSLSPSSAAGKFAFAEQLDKRDVAARIEADEHGIDEAAVGEADFHGGASGSGDVEVRQGVAVGRDDDAGAAAVAVGREDGDRGLRDAGDRFDAGFFGGEDVGVGGGLGEGGGRHRQTQCKSRVQMPHNFGFRISDFGLAVAIRNPQSAIRNCWSAVLTITSRSWRRTG